MYDHTIVEDKWSKYWKESKLFLFDEKDKKRRMYVIDTPPPFTSGELHIGNVLGIILYDTVARYKRMRGYNVLLPNGWDAQGFPTEKAVEKKYGKSLPREEFYNKCLEMSTDNIGKMRKQLDRFGFVYDPRYEYSTISPEYRRKVQLSLILMHEKGFIYRDSHPVMWCVSCASAIANAEVEEREETSSLNYVKFKLKGAKGWITIATSRPEMIHACVAVAVNPSDEKYRKLVGKMVDVPLSGRSVEIVADGKVEAEYGTGAEMVCTFGDKADMEMFYRHKLPLIEAMDEKGILKNAGKFDNMHVSKARDEVIKALKEDGALEKQEQLKHTVKVHDRCGTRIEFIKSKQWFIRIREHAKRINDLAKEVKWYPHFAEQRLHDWANFIDWDWTISRNRVYGTPIPFWYCEKCDQIVPADKEKLPAYPHKDPAPQKECPKCGSKLIGETATCDVWVDSSITPLVILGWPDNMELVERGLPTSLREQGTEIIRTWAFYTLFRVWALTGKLAWKEALINGMVLGIDGKIMHKSAGTGFVPSELLAKGYSVDSVRLWAALSGAIGKDKQFSYNEIDHAKAFIVKLYNSSNFVDLALGKGKAPKEEPHGDLNIFDMWILNRLNEVVKKATESYEGMNFYEAANTIIGFYWHEFADYYIENVKHRVYSEDKKSERSKHAAIFTLKHVLDTTIRLLAPITPFVSEEINSLHSKRSVFESEFPVYIDAHAPSDYVINGFIQKSGVNVDYVNAGALLNNIISEVRKGKAKGRVALNKEISSININVPEEYYSAVEHSKGELASICKAGKVNVSKGEYSVDVKI